MGETWLSSALTGQFNENESPQFMYGIDVMRGYPAYSRCVTRAVLLEKEIDAAKLHMSSETRGIVNGERRGAREASWRIETTAGPGGGGGKAAHHFAINIHYLFVEFIADVRRCLSRHTHTHTHTAVGANGFEQRLQLSLRDSTRTTWRIE